MTEAEWRTCPDPRRMLAILKRKASERKLRLFAVACCRRIWHLMTEEASHLAVAVVERRADGLASHGEFLAAQTAAGTARDAAEVGWLKASHDQRRAAYFAASGAYEAAYDEPKVPESGSWHSVVTTCEEVAGAVFPRDADDAASEYARQASDLRDIFGNPFRPVTIDPAWLTPAVVTLASTIYDQRGFDRMPELADALERIGCTNADVLKHCRAGGPHVRGCWVVDLVLGKR